MPVKPKKSKRFRYNLETVLKVRAIREKQEQERYNEALRKVEVEKQKEQALKDEEVRNYDKLREIMSGHMQKINEIMSRKFHLERLKEKIDEQIKTRESAEEKAEEQKLKLVEAMRAKKIMVKDREKKRMAWKKLMDKEDSKFLDDIAGIGYDRKRRNP